MPWKIFTGFIRTILAANEKKYTAKHDLHFFYITYVFIFILCFYCSEITNTYRKQGIKKSRFNIGTVQEHISK